MNEYKSFYKTAGGDEGDKCLYNTRLNVYGCGCEHDCKYCYAKPLLSFRGLWNLKEPSVADIEKIEKVVQAIPEGTIVRLGGMSDCFQPLEVTVRVALKTIKLLNHYGIGYLIMTKSRIIAEPEYLEALDKELAHIQITVTCLDDEKAGIYENASPPSMRIKAVLDLQKSGFDVALRVSPLIEEYIDFPLLNSLSVNKYLVEFLRVNSDIKKWFSEINYDKYTLCHGNYWHLPLEEKQRILKKFEHSNVSVCEDVLEHYEYWRNHYNPNRFDCCNLRLGASQLTIRQNNLPQTIEELSRFVLVGREKLTAVRAEIRAINKLGLADEVRHQKLEEAQMISEAALDAEVRIGALTAQIPKANGGDRKSENIKNDTAVDFGIRVPKSEAIRELGFTQKQVERFETLAKNSEIVEQAKEKARANDDIVSCSLVLKKIKKSDNKKRGEELKTLEPQKSGNVLSEKYVKATNKILSNLLCYDSNIKNYRINRSLWSDTL